MFASQKRNESDEEFVRKIKSSRRFALFIDFEKLKEISPITLQVEPIETKSKREESMTLLDWVKKFSQEDIAHCIDEDLPLEEWKTKRAIYSQKLSHKNDELGIGLLKASIELLRKAPISSIINTGWYFIREDRVIDDVHFSWKFFLARAGEIILEQVNLYGGIKEETKIWDYFYNPVEDQIWCNEQVFKEAQAIWMYRKYFKETNTGQIEAIIDELKRVS